MIRCRGGVVVLVVARDVVVIVCLVVVESWSMLFQSFVFIVWFVFMFFVLME